MLAQQNSQTSSGLSPRGFIEDGPVAGLLNRRRFRDLRFQRYIAPIVNRIIDEKGSCTILDVGGDPDYWQADRLPQQVKIVVLNIENKDRIDDRRFEIVQGDARDLRDMPNDSFDFVHSNSLIEHVGRWSDMQKTANEIRRLARTYYVQTPNYWFPIDPHSNVPFVHWMPHPLQRRIFTSKSRGFYRRAETVGDAMSIIDGTNMLDATQMTTLFPDAKIVFEKLALFNKSLIAMKIPSH